MPQHPASRTVEQLEQMIKEMQRLVASPRIQQKTWVALGKTWLPVLEDAKEDLRDETAHYALLAESYQGLLSSLERVGLRLIQRDRDTWAYGWFGAAPTGAYPSQGQAIEAALRERLPASKNPGAS